jgi:fused signal recognition particle receptor
MTEDGGLNEQGFWARAWAAFVDFMVAKPAPSPPPDPAERALLERRPSPPAAAPEHAEHVALAPVAPPPLAETLAVEAHADGAHADVTLPIEASLPADAVTPDTAPAPTTAVPVSWWHRLKSGLARSSSALGEGVTALLTTRKLDAATLEELEDILIQADLGVATASAMADKLREGRFGREIAPDEVKAVLAETVEGVLAPVAVPLALGPASGPQVILVVGVNGSGKTTTIGKLAAKFKAEGRSVMLAAGDTFRAAAIDQLKVWGTRNDVPVFARDAGSDSASLAFDAFTEARAKALDVLLVDTAGRLQNKAELMAELEKVVRVLRKIDSAAPHHVLLVLDATTGQNALGQVDIFGKTAGVTGLVMTKLDGTARGGILVAIAAKYRLPVHFIGVGEGIDDLEPFSAREFARAIAGLER